MQQNVQTQEPIIRFADDEVALAAQLVPQYGFEEAERIIELSARTHRPVDAIVADAA